MYRSLKTAIVALSCLALTILVGCGSGGSSSSDDPTVVAATAESCMNCHNGSIHNDYAGPGLENPHPFPGAGTLLCTTCHGGNGDGVGAADSHVPPPPEIGDEANQENNNHAYFNRLTLTGIDKFPDYTVNGQTYTALDYLQFINPGDLRVVTEGRSCGSCHMPHAECVAKSPLATSTGILSGAMYAIGVANQVIESQGQYEDTAADLSFRAVEDENFVAFDPVGAVPRLLEFPVFSVRDANGALDIDENQDYNVFDLINDINLDGTVIPNSPLANLYHEQIAFTCGDCHLGSAGANNRYGDYRSSGCTSCHMRYSLDGRSRSTDPNITKFEPADVDDIDAPERPHVNRHMIQSIARTLTTGETIQGIDDYTCAGCHQGSNRTVMQYWGIRLDQNQDVRRNNQYPTNPVDYQNTAQDTRLFDPVVNNRTFNGRNPNQYLLFEDYDGDGRDDTPPDVHYEAGLGCIDCHGSHDLHGGTVGDVANARIFSRQEQAVAIRCESCHGSVDSYAPTVAGQTYTGQNADLAMDSLGNPLKHVRRDSDGNYYLTSRLTGNVHYVSQTRDVVVDSGKVNPFTNEPVFNIRASFAMGRADGDPDSGLGPIQDGASLNGFSHTDNMSCVSCHASWTNNCIGCHLGGEYNRNNNFSNITGDRIVFRQANADFVYQSPVPFQLGIDSHNKISPIAPNTEVFFQYRDLNDDDSQIFKFSDRNQKGANTAHADFPALSHNAMMPHSIRGRVTANMEGPRYCMSCHLTTDGLALYGADYTTFMTAMNNNNFGALNYTQLQEHIGTNPGNRLNSPMWVHMVAGLGSGLFLFDENGCPTNPLDDNEDRFGCDGTAPVDNLNAPAFNLDRIVNPDGTSAGSNNHPLLNPGVGPNLRDGADNPNMAGPLGATLVERLADPTTGIVLQGWLNANGGNEGNAASLLANPQLLELEISTSADDAEEAVATTVVTLNDADLQLGEDGGLAQIVGLRFPNVTIPTGAVVVNSYIQFEAAAGSLGNSSLVIFGEDADNATAFTATNGNLSGRTTTTATVAWTPLDWEASGAAGPAERTPSVSLILQEIIGRGGWASGNAVVLLISGTGQRDAEAFDGGGTAATLVIAYITP